MIDGGFCEGKTKLFWISLKNVLGKAAVEVYLWPAY